MGRRSGRKTRKRVDWPGMLDERIAWQATPGTPDEQRASAMLDFIEDCEVPYRFVPDWGDESVKNAA